MSTVTRYNTKKGPQAIGPYSTVSIYKNVAYVSGQIGIDPSTGELIGPDVESQAKRAMDNIQVILDELKVPMKDIIKATVFLKNMSDFAKVNAIYGSYFSSENYPSRVAFAVAELPKSALVEIEVCAAFPGVAEPRPKL